MDKVVENVQKAFGVQLSRSMSEDEYLEKMNAAGDALAAGAGQLPPDVASGLIDTVVDQSILTKSGLIRMAKVDRKWEQHKIGIGTRAAQAATEGAHPFGSKKATFSKIDIEPKEIIVPIDVSYSMFEENIEKQTLQTHLLSMFGKALNNNIEQLLLTGNALGPHVFLNELDPAGSATQVCKDTFLGLQDGLLKRLDAGTYRKDLAGASMGHDVFSDVFLTLPSKFRNRSNLFFLADSNSFQYWNDRLARRGTGLGDGIITGERMMNRWCGIPVYEVPLLDQTPVFVEHLSLSTSATTLRHKPVQGTNQFVVTAATITGAAGIVPLVEGTDYTVDYSAGTVTLASGTLAAKVTYRIRPSLPLLTKGNMMVGIGRDITLESERDTRGRVIKFTLTAKLGFGMEEETANVFGYGLSTSR